MKNKNSVIKIPKFRSFYSTSIFLNFIYSIKMNVNINVSKTAVIPEKNTDFGK